MNNRNKLYASLFHDSRDAVIFFKGTRIVDANKAALDLFEVGNINDFSGKEIYEYTRDETEAKRRAESKQKGLSESYTRKIYTKKGVKDIEVSSTPINHPEISSFSIIRDITEKKELENKYRSVFMHLNDLVAVTNTNGIVFINPKGVEYLGLSSAEKILGDPSINYIHPDYREIATKYAEERRTGGNPPSKYRVNMISQDGRVRPVEFNVSLIMWEDEPSSLVIARDIEEQVELEKELAQKNELLNNFMEYATDGFNILDSDLNLIEINKVALNRFGILKEDVIGKNITELRPDAVNSGLVDKYKKVLETGEPYFDEFTIDTNEVGFRYLTVKAFRIGKQLGVITTDITDQKRQANEIQRSREQLYAFMESATEGLALFDKNMFLIEANNVWLENADLTREQAIGKYCEDLFPTLAETGRLDAYFNVINTGEPVQFKNVAGVRGMPHMDIKAFKAGEGLGLISSDVTEDIKYNYMLEQLHQLGDSLSRAQNIEEIAEIVVETVTETLNCKRVSFQTKTSNKIVIHAARPEVSVREIPFDEPSIVKRVFRTGQPQHIQDTTQDPEYLEAISEDELPSLSEYAHPVKLKGQTIAVINLEEPEKNAFTEQTIRLVSILADHVSAALHTQSYRDKLEKMHRGATYLASAESLEEVYEITLDILEETLGYTWAGVAVVDAHQLRYVHFSGSHPSGEPVIPLNQKSVAVRTVKTGKTQWVRDTRLDPDYVTLGGIYEPNLSELSVPVFIDGSVRLVLNQESREVDAFDESDVRLVELLANHVSTAMESILSTDARLKYEKQLESLNRFGAEIDRLNTLEEIAVYTMDTILNILKHSTGSFGIVKDGYIRFIELMGPTTTPVIPLTQKGITTRAVVTSSTQLVPDTRLDPDYLNGRVEGEMTLSELDVPVVVENECVAVINLEHSQLNHFSQSDANLIEIMAEHIAANIIRIDQNMKILESERRAIREQERAEQAIELEEMKTNFIRTATHEIRTPLTSIKGYTQLAQMKLQDMANPDLDKYFDAIWRNTERLEYLSADLLDVQRIESGQIQLTKAPTYIRNIMGNLGREMKPILDSKNQTLRIIGDDYLVYVDRIRLMQVFVNLVMNASKFSPEGSTITITLEAENRTLRASVIDEGVGISSEDMPKLFKPFPGIRVKGVKDSTGLGLSICKGLVEIHGGEIWAESEGLGNGSRFTFTCPCIMSEGNE